MVESMLAVRVPRHGGPEVLVQERVAIPSPGAGQVRLRVVAAGVNFIDVYHRTGLYPVPPPFTPGMEGAGTVEAIGPGVDGFAVGDRVAWCMQLGGYAQHAVVPVARIVRVPDAVSLESAAAVLLQGLTAHYLACSTFALKGGDVAVVHAAAGGTGALLVQVARLRGARVIGTVSTEAKAAVARDAGCERVVLHGRESLGDVVRAATDGRGADVVYDSIGRDTFDVSLSCVRRRGLLVTFGQSSGPVPPIDVRALTPSSRFLSRPSLADHVDGPGELASRAAELFGWLADGRVRLRIERELPLADAGAAHRLLEGRATAGKLLLRT